MSKGKLILLLIGITFITYFSSFGNPFIWDDEQLITNNVYVQQFDVGKILTTNADAGAGVRSNYYRPLTSLIFAVNTKIWGMNVFGFHLCNTAVHIAAGVLLFLLLLEIGLGEWISFFLALFFLIHPVQTEAVVYMNSLSDSLFAAFLFGSFLLFQKNLSSKRSIGQYLIAGILFLLALFSKETAIGGLIVYPSLLGLFALKKNKSFHRVFTWFKREWFFLFLFVFVASLYVALRLTVLNFADTLNFYTTQSIYTRSIFVRLFTFARVIWVYVGLLLWPHQLHMERSVGFVRSFFSSEVVSLLFLVLGISIIGIWEVRKKQTAYIFFGFLLSSALLLPVSGIIPINGLLYEHWLYVPMVGFFLMLYGIGNLLIKLIPYEKFIHSLIFFVYIILSIIYGFLTIQQNALWSDPVIFYRYTLRFAPDSARLHNNLGMSLINAGKVQDAIREYKRSLSLNTSYPQIYNNLGNAYLVLGQYHDAEPYLLQALKMSPQFIIARINLIKAYIGEKNFSKAKELAAGNQQLLQAIESAEQENQ